MSKYNIQWEFLSLKNDITAKYSREIGKHIQRKYQLREDSLFTQKEEQIPAFPCKYAHVHIIKQ